MILLMDFLQWVRTWSWGTVPDWVAGMATSSAFIFTVAQLSRERRLRKVAETRSLQSARRTQAEAVSVWLDVSTREFVVSNASGSMIYDVFLRVVDGRQNSMDSARSLLGPPDSRGMLAIVPPGITRMEAEFSWGMHFVPTCDVVFRDARGITWFRTNRGELQELSVDVFHHYGLSLPYSYRIPSSVASN